MKKEYDKEELSTSSWSWYRTFMHMNIPIFGWIYLLILTRSKKQPQKREFARAYLLYKTTILVSCILLLVLAIHVAIPYAEQLLDYMEML